MQVADRPRSPLFSIITIGVRSQSHIGLWVLQHMLYGSYSSHAFNSHLAVYCAYARLESFVLLTLVMDFCLHLSHGRDTIYNLTPGSGAGDLWRWMLNLYILLHVTTYREVDPFFLAGGIKSKA